MSEPGLPLAGTYMLGLGVWVLVFMRPPPRQGSSLLWWLKVPVMPLIALAAVIRQYSHSIGHHS